MKPGSDRTLFCLTDLKGDWILRNLTFGEVLAILASRPRSADADLLFWTEEWSDWKGFDDPECLPFRTPRVETQSPPSVPLVPILMGLEDAPPAHPKPTAMPQSTAKPQLTAKPQPSAPSPAPEKAAKPSKKRGRAPLAAEEPEHPALAESAKPPSLSELMRTSTGPKLSVNPEFQQKAPLRAVETPPPEPEAPGALPDVLPAPPAGVVTIPEPVPLTFNPNAKSLPDLKPTAPPQLVTPSGKVVPPPPGFQPPPPEASEDTPPPSFSEETRAPWGHPETEERGERTEVTSVQPMDRHAKAPPPREGGAALRKFERYAIQMPVIVQTTTEQFSTWTLDVSEGGIRIKDQLPDSFAGYAQVVLMPKNRAPFHLLGAMVEDQTDGRYHLQFMDSPTMVEFIAWMREQPWAAA